jgi:hypothetical protein
MFTNGAAEPPDLRINPTNGHATNEPSQAARLRATDPDRDA